MDTNIIDILVAEDNEDDIILLEEAFEDANLINSLYVVRDGEQAMTYLRGKLEDVASNLPGLILLDINMPRKNGFEVLEELKSNPDFRHVPVVMLTTSNREEDILRSYKGGACTYIRKPLTFDSMLDVVKKFALYWGLVATLPGNRNVRSET